MSIDADELGDFSDPEVELIRNIGVFRQVREIFSHA